MQNKQTIRLAGMATLVVLGLLPKGVLYAQDERVERGRIEVGIRQIAGERSSSKFEEYRQIRRGFFLQSFRLNLDNLAKGRYFFKAQTRETLERDQSYLLSFGRYAKYRFDFRWDQTPHVFTSAARTLFLESNRGVFTISAPVRSALQSRPGDLPLVLEGARPLDISLQRDLGSGMFVYTPTANWGFQVQYAQEKQTGVRPFGTTTNAFTNMIELPEPIDYRTHRVKAGAEYGNRLWGIQATYMGSIFKNNVDTLVWDNPFRVSDAVGAASRGQLDLYPDNVAHSVSLAGALNLTKSTRFMASIVPGWMRQNDPFLPFTINTALSGLPPLPATSLDGKKQTLAMNYTVTSSVTPSWSLTGRYRSYDYNNDTPSFIFSDYVRTDAGLVGLARRNLPYAYDRKTLGFDASWEFLEGDFLKLGYEWERFDRAHRDVERSREHTVSAALDLSPKKWLLFRTSYQHSWREPKQYEANEESFPLGEGAFALGQIHELRKFDEAARDRDRAEALVQISPLDTLTFSASYGTTQDRYGKSLFGLYHDINHNYSFELTYSPRPEFSLFAEYTREKYRYSQRSRQRVPPTATAPANDSSNNDWQSRTSDLVDTWGTGWLGSLFKNKVNLEAFYSLSAAKGSILTTALGSASIPGFLVTTARDYPDTNNRFHQVVSSIKFQLADRFYPKFEYRLEKYGRTDFQTERISPYMVPLDPATSTSIFLGANVPGYKVHIIAFALEYRF